MAAWSRALQLIQPTFFQQRASALASHSAGSDLFTTFFGLVHGRGIAQFEHNSDSLSSRTLVLVLPRLEFSVFRGFLQALS